MLAIRWHSWRTLGFTLHAHQHGGLCAARARAAGFHCSLFFLSLSRVSLSLSLSRCVQRSLHWSSLSQESLRLSLHLRLSASLSLSLSRRLSAPLSRSLCVFLWGFSSSYTNFQLYRCSWEILVKQRFQTVL